MNPNEPCDECGVDTLALLKERDSLRSQNEKLREALKFVYACHGTGSDLEFVVAARQALKEASR